MRNTLRLPSKAISLALVLLFIAGLAFGQTTKGSIAGVVTDNTSAVITGATVTAIASEGGEPRTATTGPNGEYRIEALMPGTYTVSITASGFAKKNVQNVVVSTSSVTPTNIVLGIASTSDAVTVEATAQQIQTETGELSKTLPQTSVKDLPYSSLNPYALATTLPGVSTTASRDNYTNGTSFSVNGLRPRSNNFLLDGFDNNDNDLAGQAFQPNNVESVQEVAVLTNSYSAEYGRGGGSVSNLTFRSGSNNLHGALWEQYSGAGLNALTSEESKLNGQTRPAQFVNNIFGFRVGGPVVKNKLFFFGTSQWNRFYGAQSAPDLFVPTAAGLANLQAIAANNPTASSQANLLLRSLKGLNGNVTNNTFLADAGIRSGCNSLVLPNNGGTVYCPIEIGEVTRTDTAKSLSREWTVRSDYVGTNDSIFVRYTDSMGSLTPDLFANAGALFTNETQQGGPSRLFGTMWSHTFSPSILNEFRFSAQQINFTFDLTPGTKANPDSALPSLALFDSIGPSFGGPSSNFPQGRGHKTLQFQDSVSWTRGTHAMKLGADVAVLLIEDQIPFNGRGTISFSSGGTCGSDPVTHAAIDCTDMMNYLDGFLGQQGAISKSFGNPRASVPTLQQAFYFQDSWKFRPNVTVDYGIRYEYQPADAVNVLLYPGVNRGLIAGENTIIASQTRHELQNDRNNFGPRFGFAYTPRFLPSLFGQDKTVIRGGFGIFYDAFFNNISDNVAGTYPNAVVATLNQTATAANPRGQGNALNTLFGLAPTVNLAAATTTGVVDNLVNPLTYQWNFNLQRELPLKLQTEVAYVGTRGTRLYDNEQLNARIVNTANLAASSISAYTTAPRIDTLRNSIVVRGNRGDSIYHGLQTSISRSAKGMTLRGSYTWSRAIDNQSEVFVTSGGATRWMNVFDPSSDRGPSAFNRTHRAAISYVYELPFKPSNQLLKYVLGGWATGGIISFQSGTPETIYLSGYDMNGDGETANDRPVLGNSNVALNYSATCRAVGSGCITGVGQYTTSGTLRDFWSHATGTANQFKYILYPQNSGVQGTIGRNSFTYPGRQDWDMSVFKRIPMPYREGHEVELRADLFNAFNHPNEGVSGFQGNLLNANFLNIDQTLRGGRSMVLWLKYQF